MAERNRTKYTHDAAGNVDAATDARGKTADFSYDAAGRLTEIDLPDRTLQYSYDQGSYGAGRLTGVSDSQSTVTWSYDAPGRVTQRTQTVDTVTLTVAYGFDAYGRPSTLTTPSGQVIGYSYGNGRVTGLTVNGGTLLGQMTYRPFGPISGWQWGNGSTAARTYDTDGRLTGISSAGTTSYAYFLDGQIKSTTDDVEYSPVLTAGSTLYTVDTASNRVQSASGLDARSYSYDAAGNTLSDGTRTYTYNDSGRLATATHNGVTTSYVYNGLGQRVKKSNAGVTRYFAYDEAGHLLGEYDAQGDLIQETVWLGDIPVATLRPDGSGGIDIFYVHTDHLNTPRRVTRPVDNVVVWRWQSAPFGATAADEDPDGDQTSFTYNLRFPGQYYDDGTGLHYNYFRTYDPSTGRYLESDPIGLLGGLNTYGYVGGNPMSFVDSLGLAIQRICNHFFLRRDDKAYFKVEDDLAWTSFAIPGMDWTLGPDIDFGPGSRRSPRPGIGITPKRFYTYRIDAIDVKKYFVSESARIMEKRCKLIETDDCTGETVSVINSGSTYRVVDELLKTLISTIREYRVRL